jgi:hypothetical protein
MIGEPSETVAGQHIPDLFEPLAMPKQHTGHIIGHGSSAPQERDQHAQADSGSIECVAVFATHASNS